MRVFVVSAGHSDVDPGAVANGVKEADIAEDLRNIVASKLREAGHTVITDGDGEVNQPLSEAVKLINRGELAIEIHCNAAGSVWLSQRLSKAIAAVTKDKVRGDGGWIDQSKSARGRLAFVNAGGIIIELFFLTNQQALEQYNATKWLVASAITDEMVKGA